MPSHGIYSTGSLLVAVERCTMGLARRLSLKIIDNVCILALESILPEK